MIPLRFRPHYYNYEQTFINIVDLELAEPTADAPDPSDECIICMHNLRFEVDEQM